MTTNPASEPNRRVRPRALVAMLGVGLALGAIVIGFGAALGGATGDGTALEYPFSVLSKGTLY